MANSKVRKDRSDITVGKLEKKHGMPPGTIRNSDGRDTRSDKKLGTIRDNPSNSSSKKTESQVGGPLSQANDKMEEAWGKIYSRKKTA